MRYFYWSEMKKTEIIADSVGVRDDEGNEYELHFRTTDKEMSLSAERGQLLIEPRASNVVRLKVRR